MANGGTRSNGACRAAGSFGEIVRAYDVVLVVVRARVPAVIPARWMIDAQKRGGQVPFQWVVT